MMIKQFKNGWYVNSAVMAQGFVGLGIEWDNTDKYIMKNRPDIASSVPRDMSLSIRLLKFVISVGKESAPIENTDNKNTVAATG